MRSAISTSAWLQGIALVVVIGVLAALLLLEAHQPFDRDTLAILTGQLRSDAYESRELLKLEAAHVSFATFTQQHARQLGEHVADAATTLRGNRAVATIEPIRRDAEELARDLDTALSAVAADPASASDKAAQLDGLCARADTLHLRLKPGG